MSGKNILYFKIIKVNHILYLKKVGLIKKK